MGHKRGPEIDDGTRGAIVGLHKKARLPFTDITNLTGVPETTAKNIVKHAVANAKESLGREALNLSNDTLEEQITTLACKAENVHPKARPGAPPALSPRQIDRLIHHATLNRANRYKKWEVIAKELNIIAAQATIHKAFHERGYGRYSPRRKPHLTPDQKETRYNWALARQKFNWTLVYWTDESSMNLGISKDRGCVTRTVDEEWLDDCTKDVFKESSGLMFWGSIAYNWKGPCVVIKKEVKAVRDASIAMLEADAIPAWKEAMDAHWVKWMNYKMAKGWNHCTTKKKEKVLTGKLPVAPRLSSFGPGRSEKGGIDWYRYQVDILPYLLDDFERFQ
jgi:hypothetical protein